MIYQTFEVDLENGHVRPRGAEKLPDKAWALLTILESGENPVVQGSECSLEDRVSHLAGIESGESTDLSTNKAHLEDLGR